MKQHTKRLSFDVPEEEHLILKIGCAHQRISIKDFLIEMWHKSLKELSKKQLQERLKESVKQSKDGKVKSRGSFAKYVKDEI
jgi:hypothetical protein